MITEQQKAIIERAREVAARLIRFQEATTEAFAIISRQREAEGLPAVGSKNALWGQVWAKAEEIAGFPDPRIIGDVGSVAEPLLVLIGQEAGALSALFPVPPDPVYIEAAKAYAPLIRAHRELRGQAEAAVREEWRAAGIPNPEQWEEGTMFHGRIEGRLAELAGGQYPDNEILRFGPGLLEYIADTFALGVDTRPRLTRPEQFIHFQEETGRRIAALEASIRAAFEEVAEAPVPSSIRPATPADVIVGAVFWYPDFKFRKWLEVEEIRDPESDYKAFVSGGARYGLLGAFVEVKEGTVQNES